MSEKRVREEMIERSLGRDPGVDQVLCYHVELRDASRGKRRWRACNFRYYTNNKINLRLLSN